MKTWKFIIITFVISFVAIFVNLFPHYYAWSKTPEGFIFSGQASWFDPWDINVYVAAIRWGQNHGLLMENMYDSIPNRPIIYYPVYTLAGQLYKRCDPFLLFYGFSAVTGVILIATIVYFFTKIYRHPKIVFFASLTTIFAGGLGYLTYPYIASLDNSMTSFSFHSALQRPHEGLAVASYIATLLGLFFFFDQKEKANKHSWLAISIFSLLLTLIFYPYYLLSCALIGSSIFMIEKSGNLNKKMIFFGVFLAVGTLVASAMQINLSLSSSLAGVINQRLSNPTLSSLMLGYGLLLFPFIYFLTKFKKLSTLQKFCIVWISTDILLAFLPFGFARFFLRGVFFPLIVLAVDLIIMISIKYFDESRQQFQQLLLLCLLVFTSMTSLSIFSKRIHEAGSNNQWIYLSKNDYEALQFMKKELPQSSNILSSYYLGNLIPAFSDNRVYFGHLLQTPEADNRIKQLELFYSCFMNEEEARNFISQANVQYVFLGEEEKGYSQEKEKNCNYQFLTPIFSTTSNSLERVDNIQ